MPKKKLFLILDGNALLHRAWHAIPPLTTRDGRIVNAAYGFAMVLEKMLETRQPDYMAVAWDLPGKTFRHEKYEDYKGTREKKGPELYDQIPMIQELLEAFGVPSISAEGFEADDVIGTLAMKMDQKPEVGVEIVTGDLDALQLVTKGTKVLFFVKGISETKLYDEAAVRERYGLEPDQLIDYKALKGDASDNIPGVPGVGDKTATEAIQKFGSLDNLYEKLAAGESDGLSERMVKKLLDHKQEAYDSQELVTIVCDMKIDFKLTEAKVKEPDADEIMEMYQDLEFRSLIRKREGKVEKAEKSNQELKIKKTGKAGTVLKDLSELKGAKEIGLFVGVNQQTDLFGSGLSILAASDGKKTVVVSSPKPADLKQVIELASQAKCVIVHDLKQMLAVLSDLATGNVFDLMIGSYLCNPGSRAHDLSIVMYERLGKKVTTPPTNFDSVAEIDWVNQVVSEYSTIQNKQTEELKDIGSFKLFKEIEMPLVPILFKMEQNGIKIDTKFLDVFSKKLAKQIETLTIKIHKLAGVEFNIKSPLQLTEVLFEKLDLPTKGIKRTKSGYSTAAPELEKLRAEHKIIPLIEEYRELTKLASTYVDALPKLVADDGRVHTSFNQTVTATGRLSSSDPNLQNIPIRTELGREIRKAFVADEGNVLLSADYSQIDLRAVTIITKDKAFTKAFKEGVDIHTRTAAEILGIKESEVTKSQRSSAKAINFGIIYGMGPRALAASTDLTFKEAQIYIEEYLNAHPAIQKYLARTKEQAHELGYVETMFGRRRYLPEIDSGMQMLVASAERMAINMPVQGAASDIMKMAMIKVSDWIADQTDIRMLLQVHDEIVLEVPKSKAEAVGKAVKEILEATVDFDIPFVADVEIGANWGDLK